jgi:hypothetical protein
MNSHRDMQDAYAPARRIPTRFYQEQEDADAYNTGFRTSRAQKAYTWLGSTLQKACNESLESNVSLRDIRLERSSGQPSRQKRRWCQSAMHNWGLLVMLFLSALVERAAGGEVFQVRMQLHNWMLSSVMICHHGAIKNETFTSSLFARMFHRSEEHCPGLHCNIARQCS